MEFFWWVGIALEDKIPKNSYKCRKYPKTTLGFPYTGQKDVMLVVAREGIEPPTVEFVLHQAKWVVRINEGRKWLNFSLQHVGSQDLRGSNSSRSSTTRSAPCFFSSSTFPARAIPIPSCRAASRNISGSGFPARVRSDAV